MIRRLKATTAHRLALAALVVVCLAGCATLPEAPLKPADPLRGWVGDYHFEELLGVGEEDDNEASINYHITIANEAGGYSAVITMDGFQTQQNLTAVVQGDPNWIMLIFTAYVGDNLWEPYTAGEVLLTLSREGDDLVTIWGAIMPQLEQNQSPGQYFHGNVG